MLVLSLLHGHTLDGDDDEACVIFQTLSLDEDLLSLGGVTLLRGLVVVFAL